MDAPARLLMIFCLVCFGFSIFPPDIRLGLDPMMARVAIAAGTTLVIAGLHDVVVGFVGGWKRGADRRKTPS